MYGIDGMEIKINTWYLYILYIQVTVVQQTYLYYLIMTMLVTIIYRVIKFDL